jgi:hypothetical protein
MVGTEPVFIASMSSSETDRKLNTLYLESYGVRVRIESNNKRLFNDARRQTEHALVGNFRIIDPVETPHVFRLEREEGGYSQVKNGEKSGVNKSRKVLLRYFDSTFFFTPASLDGKEEPSLFRATVTAERVPSLPNSLKPALNITLMNMQSSTNEDWSIHSPGD